MKRQGLLAIGLAGVLASCERDEDWSLFLYPNGASGYSIITPGFRDRELCLFAGREAAQSHRSMPGVEAAIERGERNVPSFECGLNCRMDRRIQSISVCETTVD